MMTSSGECSLRQDGKLDVNLSVKDVVHHSVLNVILITTHDGHVHVLDVNSGVILQSKFISDSSTLRCTYFEDENKVLMANDNAIGIRSDYNGVLFLDTILQHATKCDDDTIKLDMLLSEAILFLDRLGSFESGLNYFLQPVYAEFVKKVNYAQLKSKQKSRHGIKALRWNTVSVELKLSLFRAAVDKTMAELKLKDGRFPDMGLAASFRERLLELCTTSHSDTDDYYSEYKRLQSFEKWPHMDYKWALPDQMAQAGFYHSPNNTGDDRVLCFACSLCLVTWEHTDEPWTEHERHAPRCPFIKGEYTFNVPLSVSYATTPAQPIDYVKSSSDSGDVTKSKDIILGMSNVTNYTAVGTQDGFISVYNFSGKLRRTHCFYLSSLTYCFPKFEGYHVSKGDITLTSLSIVGPNRVKSATNAPIKTPPANGNVLPCILCGVTLKLTEQATENEETVKLLNDENTKQDQEKTSKPDDAVVIELPETKTKIERETNKEVAVVLAIDFLHTSFATSIIDQVESNTIDGDQNDDGWIDAVMPETKLHADVPSPASPPLGPMLYKPSITNAEGETFASKWLSGSAYHSFLPPNNEIYIPLDVGVSNDTPTAQCDDETKETPKVKMTKQAMSTILEHNRPTYLTKEALGDDGEEVAIYLEYLNSELQKKRNKITSETKSISDHISDMISSEKHKAREVSYTHMVQLINFSASDSTRGMYVDQIIPFRSSDLVLVVLRTKIDNLNVIVNKCALMIFSLDLTRNSVKLKQDSENSLVITDCNLIPTKIVLLPSYGNNYAACVCDDGALRILNLNTLEYVSEVKNYLYKYVAVTYCSSLERLCVCTENGPIHFYALFDANTVSDDKFDVIFLKSFNHDTKSDERTFTDVELIDASNRGDIKAFSDIINCGRKLTGKELRRLQSLSECESQSSQNFCALFPSCWNEIQACSWRKANTASGGTSVPPLSVDQFLSEWFNPNDLSSPKWTLNRSEVLPREPNMRTWRLQSDSTSSWDEHLLEISVPWGRCIGHVDLKFKLHGSTSPCYTPPDIQVTLLKQNISSLGGKKSKTQTETDEPVSYFEFIDSKTNRTDASFNLDDMEVIAGPVNLSSYLDLSSELCGRVVLTSPSLIQSRNRALLIHIKANMNGNKYSSWKNYNFDVQPKTVVESPYITFGTTNTVTNNNKRNDEYVGCDCIHELSIGITNMKSLKYPNERTQRLVLLNSIQLVDNLCQSVCDDETDADKCIALDMLIWLASIRFGDKARNQDFNVTLLNRVGKYLESLITTTLINGDRALSHKIAKLLIVCIDYDQHAQSSSIPLDVPIPTCSNANEIHSQFSKNVLSTLLKSAKNLKQIASPSGLRWFTILLNHVGAVNSAFSEVAVECVNLLKTTAIDLGASTRANVYHQVLRSVFNLYGTPFEPELFDVQAQTLPKSSSTPVTFVHPATVAHELSMNSNENAGEPVANASGLGASDNSGLKAAYGFKTTIPTNYTNETSHDDDLKNGLFHLLDSNKSRQMICRSIKPDAFVSGLIETTLLHYKCIQASEGTRVECFSPEDTKLNVANISSQTSNMSNTSSFATPPSPVEPFAGFIDQPNDDPSGISIMKNVYFKNKTDDVKVLSKDTDKDKPTTKIKTKKSGKKDEKKSQAKSKKIYDVPTYSKNQSQLLSNKTLAANALAMPSSSTIIIDKMHSDARKFVVLDFGSPVLITDILLPSCSDLISLAIDVWCDNPMEPVRLCTVTDISTKCLLLTDLQPPLLCRYMRLSVIGRYEMINTRCRIPIGYIYGHPVILSDYAYGSQAEIIEALAPNDVVLKSHLDILKNCLEQCHGKYSLGLSQLKSMLEPYVNDGFQFVPTDKSGKKGLTSKISNLHAVCLHYQERYNTLKRLIEKIERNLKRNQTVDEEMKGDSSSKNPNAANSDKLLHICDSLLNVLLNILCNLTPEAALTVVPQLQKHLDQNTCEQIFLNLCVSQNQQIQINLAYLLVCVCSSQPWWGQFLVDIITKLYSSENKAFIFPKERVIINLAAICKKSLGISDVPRLNVIDPILLEVCKLIKPLIDNTDPSILVTSKIDVQLLGWLIFYLSLALDPINDADKNNQNQADKWNWLTSATDNKDSDRQRRISMYKHKLRRLGTYNNNNKVATSSWDEPPSTTQTHNISNKKKQYMAKNKIELNDSEFHNIYNSMIIEKKSSNSKVPTSLYICGFINFLKNLPDNEAKNATEMKFEAKNEARSSKDLPNGPIINGPSNDAPSETIFLNHLHCIAACRALIQLILNLDNTCNTDLLLLSCKVVAKLINVPRLELKLNQLVSKDELSSLLRMAVNNEANQWITHALICLLQDIFGVQPCIDVPVEDSASSEKSNSEKFVMVDSNFSEGNFSESFMDGWTQLPSNTTVDTITGQKMDGTGQIDLVVIKEANELDESDTEGKTMAEVCFGANRVSTNKNVFVPVRPRGEKSLSISKMLQYNMFSLSNYSISKAIDSRLESDFCSMTEIYLKKLTLMSQSNPYVVVTTNIPSMYAKMNENTESIPTDVNPENLLRTGLFQWPENLLIPWLQSVPSDYINSTIMAKECFDTIFVELDKVGVNCAQIERVLDVWTILNIPADYNPSTVTEFIGDNVEENEQKNDSTLCVMMSANAVASLLSALNRGLFISLRTWSLLFQCLSALLPDKDESKCDVSEGHRGWPDAAYGMSLKRMLLLNDNLYKLLFNFLAGSGYTLSPNKQVGSSPVQMFRSFLSLIFARTPDPQMNKQLTDLKMQLLLRLIDRPTGLIQLHVGPVDAQFVFLEECSHSEWKHVDIAVTMDIIECICLILHAHVLQKHQTKCMGLAENLAFSTQQSVAVFSHMLTQSLLSETPVYEEGLKLSSSQYSRFSGNQVTSRRYNKLIDYEHIVFNLVRLANVLLDFKLTATSVLLEKHSRSLILLFQTFSLCTDTSNIALQIHEKSLPSYVKLKDPPKSAKTKDDLNTAVYFLLQTIRQRCGDNHELLLKAIVKFLNVTDTNTNCTTISEVFVWWLYGVLQNEDTLEMFTHMGGITLIAQNLTNCYKRMISSLPNSEISGVMQMLSRNYGSSPASYTVYHNGGQAKKKFEQAAYENENKLVNFAPYGTITSTSRYSQPAELLIQATVPAHRRARSPQWSYHFCLEEAYVELVIALPAAILLHEVQLQPHLNNLSTCPSAVSLEVSRTNSLTGLIQVCQPLATSGMSFIRVNLPKPEVVTIVLIRLYRPRDINNTIGLSQIRLLGTSPFGVTAYDNKTELGVEFANDDENNIGNWLALLHLCINLSGAKLVSQVIETLSKRQPRLINVLSALLFMPTKNERLLLFLPKVEWILFKLSTLSVDKNIFTIKTLLNNYNCINQITHEQSVKSNNVCVLLFKLCTFKSSMYGYNERNVVIFDWLWQAITFENTPNASYIQCIATILIGINFYGGSESQITQYITEDLFHEIYDWAMRVGQTNLHLKKALDVLICSFCSLNPKLVGVLVKKIGFDFDADTKLTCEDVEVMMESSKGLMCPNKCQLDVLSSVCQSESYDVIKQLKNVILKLIYVVDLWCTKHTDKMDVECLCNIIHFFGDICMNVVWCKKLGSLKKPNTDNCLKIESLLMFMCFEKLETITKSEPLLRYNLEVECVRFLQRCSSIRTNQTLIAGCLCKIIKLSKPGSISYFTRRLILQLLLEDEKVYVLIHRDKALFSSEDWQSTNASNEYPPNPELRTQPHQMLLHLNVNTKIGDVLDMCTNSHKQTEQKETTDGHPSGLNLQNWNASVKDLVKLIQNQEMMLDEQKFDDVCKTLSNIDFFNSSDQISVAAGNLAKDKRVKDAKNYSAWSKPSKYDEKTSEPSDKPNCTKCKRNLSKITEVMEWSADAPVDSDGTSESYQNTNFDASPSGKKCKRNSMCNVCKISRLYNVNWSTSTGSSRYMLKTAAPLKPRYLSNNLQLSNVWAFYGGDEMILRFMVLKDKSLRGVPKPHKLTRSYTLPTKLEIFSALGGLEELSKRLLSTLNASVTQNQCARKWPQRFIDPSAVYGSTVDDTPFYEKAGLKQKLEMVESMSCSLCSSSLSKYEMPWHSLVAFSVFLKLKGYSSIMLKDYKRAKLLLRIVLGASDCSDGSDISLSPHAKTLSTFPFEVLKNLYETTPTYGDGELVRVLSLESGIIHTIFGYLSAFTHQRSSGSSANRCGNEVPDAAVPSTSSNSNVETKPNGSNAKEGQVCDKTGLYWAKGTGFGTGSTAPIWNVEKALIRQKEEEEHITVLFLVLASFIYPDAVAVENFNVNECPPNLPNDFYEYFQQSCVLQAIRSYLRNDSVMDIARHIPLYRAILKLLRAITVCTQLANLFLPTTQSSQIIADLLVNMKTCVDTYTSRLKVNQKYCKSSDRTQTEPSSSKAAKSSVNYESNATYNSVMDELMESDEGLATLIPDIACTTQMVKLSTFYFMRKQQDNTDAKVKNQNHTATSDDHVHLNSSENCVERPLRPSLETKYLQFMKAIQFDTYEMIRECSNGENGNYKFVVTYRFDGNVRAAGDRCHPARVKRLAQEAVTLATSLPLSYSSSVFVRCDTDRLDVMKVLITGPADTPYANGCFEFDVYFPSDYPQMPVMINLETTGRKTVRFNPNLYNDGKVCLSVLNTWHGRPEEKWNAQTSSFLQVLVSIQSLILVPEPYFNEPGYERSRNTPVGTQNSLEYNANVFQANVRWAMLEQIRNPCPCFKPIIHSHFWFKRKEIAAQLKRWIQDVEAPQEKHRFTTTGQPFKLNGTVGESTVGKMSKSAAVITTLKHTYMQLLYELEKLKPPPGLEDYADETLIPEEDFPPQNAVINLNKVSKSYEVKELASPSPDSNLKISPTSDSSNDDILDSHSNLSAAVNNHTSNEENSSTPSTPINEPSSTGFSTYIYSHNNENTASSSHNYSFDMDLTQTYIDMDKEMEKVVSNLID